MGTNGALITSGNTVDLTLARLRELYRRTTAEGETPERRAQIESLKAHVHHLAGLVAGEQEQARWGQIADHVFSRAKPTSAI
jgi:hypothetical protein